MNDELKATVQNLETQLKMRQLAPAHTLHQLSRVYELMKENKPNDRSETDRCWAIAITDMQKLLAFFKVFVAESDK